LPMDSGEDLGGRLEARDFDLALGSRR